MAINNSRSRSRDGNYYHWILSVICVLLLVHSNSGQQQDFQFEPTNDDDLQVSFKFIITISITNDRMMMTE